MNAASILLVDDHPMVTRGLRLLIEQRTSLRVVGEAATGDAALRLLMTTAPDLVLFDLHLPDIDGLVLVKRFRALRPSLRILVLSSDASPDIIESSLSAGVAGYVLKECAPEELERALQTVAAGDMYVCPKANTLAWAKVQAKIPLPAPGWYDGLSRRELEVLRQIASGQNTKEVAHDLRLGVKTVETYRRRLMDKLKLRSIADLTRYAVRQGLVQA